MSTNEQLERQAEATRARIVEDVDELRERVSPGQILDETLDFTREGRAGQFVRNLGQQIVDNPIPAALVAAGLGWLIWGGRPSRRGNGYDAVSDATDAVSDASKQAADTGRHIKEQTAAATTSAAESVREIGDEWVTRAHEVASQLTKQVRGAGPRTEDLASAASEALSDTAASGYQRAAEAYDATASGAKRASNALGRSATAIGESAANSANSFAAFLKDEPLVLAGIGVALGAAIGAMFPASETEDRLMGEASDNVKEVAGELVEREWQKGKEAAEKAFEDVKHEFQQEAADLGLVPSDTSGRPALVPDKEKSAKERRKMSRKGDHGDRRQNERSIIDVRL